MIKAKCLENLKGVYRFRLKKIIAAMELLLSHYRTKGGGEEKVMEGCPLCTASMNECVICPWVVITGYECGMEENGFGDMYITDLRGKINTAWNRKRRRELPKWIAWYEAELERRADIVVTRMKRSRL